MEEHDAEVSRLLIRNDAEATLSTALKFAEPWRYRGREYCFALVAVRPERRTIHYLPQGFPSIRSWNTAGRRLTNCHFRALDGKEMRIILM